MAVMCDIHCNNPDCDFYEEDVFVDTSKDDYGTCAKCGKGKLVRTIGNKLTFELRYNNKTDMCDWDGNSSQFWKGIKEKGGELPEKWRDKWY